MAIIDDKKMQKNIEQKNTAQKTVEQNVIIENRERLRMTGVSDVESFNEDCIIAQTELGRIIIKGSGMKVSNLNLENSELCIEGYINYFEYVNKKRKKLLLFGS